MSDPSLEDLIKKIMGSKKYRHICEQTVRDIISGERAKHAHRTILPKAAVASARRRIHRVWSSYLFKADYRSLAGKLKAAFESGESIGIEAACEKILACHQSSRERIPILKEFYAAIFGITGLPGRLHDLACALNPLSFRWMNLPDTVEYRAYDINRETVSLINCYFNLEGIAPLAVHRDILCSPIAESGDVGLLLKMYHCLERRRRGAGWEVLETTPFHWTVITFPGFSLASRSVDIAANYEPQIRSRCKQLGWRTARIDFSAEVILLVEKP